MIAQITAALFLFGGIVSSTVVLDNMLRYILMDGSRIRYFPIVLSALQWVGFYAARQLISQ